MGISITLKGEKEGKMLTLGWILIGLLLWLGSLVVCYYVTRHLSRNGYQRKDMIVADMAIKPCPPESSIGRIADTFIAEAIRHKADTISLTITECCLETRYFRGGEMMTEKNGANVGANCSELWAENHPDQAGECPLGMTLPLYLATQVAHQLIAYEMADRQFPGPNLDETHNRHRLRLQVEFGITCWYRKEASGNS